MRTYVFPYGGTIGKCETWDSEIEFELTDEEAERLEASARKEPRWHLNEDEAISDICKKIEAFILEENKRIMIEDGRLDELREEWEDADKEDIPSDDELVDEDMGMWHVMYPEELQDLEEEAEE